MVNTKSQVRNGRMNKTRGLTSNRSRVLLALCALILGSVSPLAAQDSGDEHASAAAAANNPLANMTSYQLQNYYAPDLFGLPDESSNTAWLRFVKPFGKWLVRASLPLSTVPSTLWARGCVPK